LGLINGLSTNGAHLRPSSLTVAVASNTQQIQSMQALGDLIIAAAAPRP
jgi:hypothetical protein